LTRAVSYNEQIDIESPLCVAEMVKFSKFLGGEIEIEGASAPSDIIWENRMLSWKTRCQRGTVSIIIIAILLFGSGVIMTICSSLSFSLKNKYPNLHCTGEHGFFNTEYDSNFAAIEVAA